MTAKRKIHQNVWGNWRGYLGRKFSIEFGVDTVAAGHWLLTGDSDFNSGYESKETIKAAKKAAHGD